MAPSPLHDVTCVVHVHSTHSDGTGTVGQIANAARRAGADAVLLTDHDTLAARRAGEEGWWGPVLVLVGEEVTPPDRNHYLAFGVESEVDPSQSPERICRTTARAGGFGFAAHPFSRGSSRFPRFGPGYPWPDLRCRGLQGLELWSFVTDSAEKLRGIPEALLFLLSPERVVDHPPPPNLAAWDELCSRRRMAAIGGLDAHQLGVRVGGRVPLRLMSYRRTFRRLRTHALCEQPLTGALDHDRAQVYSALREGRAYIAMDSLAPARGFEFWAEGEDGALRMGDEASAGRWTLRARLPLPARLRLVRNGEVVEDREGDRFERPVAGPGAYRLEARLVAHGRERTWILTNPIYLRRALP